MLKNMMWDVYADNHADKELEKLFKKTIEPLAKERNAIVHCVWRDQGSYKDPRDGIPVFGPVPDTASGFGFPRRGKKIIIDVNKTAKEMREVAKKIQAAQMSLVGIVSLASIKHRLKVLTEADKLAKLAGGTAKPPRTKVNALSPDCY